MHVYKHRTAHGARRRMRRAAQFATRGTRARFEPRRAVASTHRDSWRVWRRIACTLQRTRAEQVLNRDSYRMLLLMWPYRIARFIEALGVVRRVRAVQGSRCQSKGVSFFRLRAKRYESELKNSVRRGQCLTGCNPLIRATISLSQPRCSRSQVPILSCRIRRSPIARVHLPVEYLSCILIIVVHELQVATVTF